MQSNECNGIIAMKIEYLLFNIIVLAGPLIMSFEPNMRFIQHWRSVLIAIILPLIPFILWDSVVTGRHWHFNEVYTLDARILALPIEEWLFFMTVPYACLFLWSTLQYYEAQYTFLQGRKQSVTTVHLLLWCCIPAGILLFSNGAEYTGLVGIALGLTAFFDIVVGTYIFSRKMMLVFAPLYILANGIFNGYLTGRPVLIYNAAYQLDVRIGTIPIEDFGYGAALVALNIIIFEVLQQRKKGSL